MKICTECKRELELENFQKRSVNKDGYNTRCKKCINLYKSGWRKGVRILKDKPEVEEGKKICSKCKETKDINCFPKSKNRKDGLNHYCKKCSNEYGKDRNYKRFNNIIKGELENAKRS